MFAWRLPTVRWPTLLLLASAGLTALGLVEASRAVRSQRAVAEHALRDYAGFAAWSYEQHLRDALNAASQEVLGAVNHGGEMHTNPRIPGARDLPHYLPMNASCGCHRPRNGPSPALFFGYVLGSDSLGVGVNTHPDPAEGWEVDRPMPAPVPAGRATGYTAAEKQWIRDTITRQIRAGGDNGRFTYVVATRDSARRLFVYTLMPTAWGDTAVYGAEYAPDAFAGMLAEVMYDRGLLPATFTRGRAMREVVQLRVGDDAGHTLFESEPVTHWALDDTASLPRTFGGLHVHAQIRPALAGALVIGGLPRSRLPFLIGLLALAAALSFVAVGQIRREDELARMRSDFVASISHELRTPLAQMRLYLETLRLGRFTTDAQRDQSLGHVERETARLTQLVERVLRFSRRGAATEERVPVDVAAEVGRIVDEFRPLAAARRVRVVASLDHAPALPLREEALRHIVLNLLDNAVKYGPAGQQVAVRVRAVGDELWIEVADEGPGVAATERDTIWLPYRRGRAVGHAAGSGIGLSVVRDVVAEHGGRAWVENGVVGARFVVALPLPSIATSAAPSSNAELAGVR